MLTLPKLSCLISSGKICRNDFCNCLFGRWRDSENKFFGQRCVREGERLAWNDLALGADFIGSRTATVKRGIIWTHAGGESELGDFAQWNSRYLRDSPLRLLRLERVSRTPPRYWQGYLDFTKTPIGFFAAQGANRL